MLFKLYVREAKVALYPNSFRFSNHITSVQLFGIVVQNELSLQHTQIVTIGSDIVIIAVIFDL